MYFIAAIHILVFTLARSASKLRTALATYLGASFPNLTFSILFGNCKKSSISKDHSNLNCLACAPSFLSKRINLKDGIKAYAKCPYVTEFLINVSSKYRDKSPLVTVNWFIMYMSATNIFVKAEKNWQKISKINSKRY